MMKYQLAFFALAVAFAYLQATPLRTEWHELVTTKVLEKGYGDIWTNCTTTKDMGIINSVVITPDPPKIGTPSTYKITFILKEVVTAGQITVSLKWNNIPFFDSPFDLCDIVTQADLSCPLAKGMHTFSTTQTIPVEAPKGDWTGSGNATDQNGNKIGCIKLKLTL